MLPIGHRSRLLDAAALRDGAGDVARSPVDGEIVVTAPAVPAGNGRRGLPRKPAYQVAAASVKSTSMNIQARSQPYISRAAQIPRSGKQRLASTEHRCGHCAKRHAPCSRRLRRPVHGGADANHGHAIGVAVVEMTHQNAARYLKPAHTGVADFA